MKGEDQVDKAKRFAKRYNAPVSLYFEMVEWNKGKDLNCKDIHARLKRRGVNISYITTYRWLQNENW